MRGQDSGESDRSGGQLGRPASNNRLASLKALSAASQLLRDIIAFRASLDRECVGGLRGATSSEAASSPEDRMSRIFCARVLPLFVALSLAPHASRAQPAPGARRS